MECLVRNLEVGNKCTTIVEVFMYTSIQWFRKLVFNLILKALVPIYLLLDSFSFVWILFLVWCIIGSLSHQLLAGFF